MKKRLLAIACAAAMVVTMFAGCNGGGESSTSSAAQESSGATSSAAEDSSAAGESSTAEESSEAAGGELSVSGDVEIEFFQQKREAVDSFQAVIDAFMEQNPNITVTQNVVPDALTVLMTRAATNDIPEVLMHWPTDSQFVQFAQQGRLKVLDDTEALGNVMENYQDAVKFEDGHTYCIPFSGNFMGVFYDVDKFEEAGYEIPATWDELIALAEDIKGKGEVAFMFPDKDAWTLSQLQSNILGKDRADSSEFYDQMDAGETTFQDDELTVQSWEKVLQLHEYSQGDTLSLGYDQCISDFATGTGYMFIQGSWAAPSIEAANPDKNFDMFPMPNDSGDIQQPLGLDTGLCLGAGFEGDAAIAAEMFLNYIASTEGAQIYADLDHSPSCIQGVEANIPQGTGVVEILDEKGVLSMEVLPAGFEETKRSKIQQVLIDGDIEGLLTTLTEDYMAALESQAAQTAE